MELYLDLEIPCRKKYEKLLIELTNDIFLLNRIKHKNCTFDKIKGIILENDIEDNYLKYSIFKVGSNYNIKMVFSNGKKELINF